MKIKDGGIRLGRFIYAEDSIEKIVIHKNEPMVTVSFKNPSRSDAMIDIDLEDMQEFGFGKSKTKKVTATKEIKEPGPIAVKPKPTGMMSDYNRLAVPVKKELINNES